MYGLRRHGHGVRVDSRRTGPCRKVRLDFRYIHLLHTVESEFETIADRPFSVDFVNRFAGAFATPPGMFVDLIVGGLFQAVVTVNPTSGDVGPGSAAIAME